MARDRLCILQFVSVAVCLWTQSVMADYYLEIRVTSYSNPTNQCADNSCSTNMGYTCCESSATTGCNDGDRCDNQFCYCLRPHNTSPTTKGCIGYEHIVTSNVNQDDAPIEFSQSTVLGLPNPMNLTGLDTIWSGVQLYIEVLDDDLFSNEFVDSFSINMNENTTKGSNLTLPDKSGTYSLATIGLTARFLCAENYTGELCERFDYCSTRQINCSEHGVCSNVENGHTCDCEPGYTGTDCETDINECMLTELECSGHGICTDEINSFTCDCDQGFTGLLCETNIDDCDGENCSGRSQCVDGVNNFTCVCDEGFTGLLCETNIDDCDGVNCSGRGQCVDGVNNFTCVCQSGYTGNNCTVDVQGGAGGIIGGVVGGLVAVILTVLLLILLVVLVMVVVRKRQDQVTKGLIQTADNSLSAVPETETIKQPTGTDVVDTVSDTVEFDNPIYGDDIEGPEYATPNTTGQPTTYETIPPLYSTITDDV